MRLLLVLICLVLAGCSSNSDVTGPEAGTAVGRTSGGDGNLCDRLEVLLALSETAPKEDYLTALDSVIAVSETPFRQTLEAARAYETGNDMALLNPYADGLEKSAPPVEKECDVRLLIAENGRLVSDFVRR